METCYTRQIDDIGIFVFHYRDHIPINIFDIQSYKLKVYLFNVVLSIFFCK